MLTHIAILALRGITRDDRERLADIGGVSVDSINRWIADNHKNLTRVDVLREIKRITGLDESQILADSKTTIAQ